MLVNLITIFAGLLVLNQLISSDGKLYIDRILQPLKASQISSYSVLSFFSMSSLLGQLPSHNLASAQFSAWLTAFNTHDRDTMLEYHKKHFPYDVASRDIKNIDNEMGLSEFTGGFEIADVVEPNNDYEQSLPPHSITVILRSKKNPHYARASMTVDPKNSSHPVTKFNIHRTHTPLKFVPDDRREEYEKALAPLTLEKRRIVVSGISDVITEQYIIPEVGKEMIESLEVKEKGGEYDKYTDSEDFAERLTEDLRKDDKHSMIIFMEPPPNHKRKDDGDNKDGDNKDGDDRKGDEECPPELCDRLKQMNYGFDTPQIEQIQNKKLGILGIKGFVPSNFVVVKTAIGAIMAQIADADALIIDLRSNGGGSPDTVAYIESYLLGEDDSTGVHLLDFVDRNGTPDKSVYTLAPSKLSYPPDSISHLRFGPTKPLFVLTSNRTVSGGEDMAYNLQAFKRARAVISADKTTAGAANIVTTPRTIAEGEFGKEWWHVGIPDQTPRHAITGGNWEGLGVLTDVIVGEGEDVVDAARKMARKAMGLDEAKNENTEL